MPMGMKNFYSEVVGEMEKSGYELTEQALIIVFGGVYGGQAFEVAKSGLPFLSQLFLYMFILSLTLATIGLLHFTIASIRVSAEDS